MSEQHRHANVPPASAERGWVFDVGDRREGAPSNAEILEVLHVPGYTMYRVRWDDGSESTLLPARDHHAHPPRMV